VPIDCIYNARSSMHYSHWIITKQLATDGRMS
jgi:hypothetical protein